LLDALFRQIDPRCQRGFFVRGVVELILRSAQRRLGGFFRQNELRYVKAGDEAEIYMMQYPGRIIKCVVDSILWATAQGQMPISGNLQNTLPVAAPEQRIAVRLVLAPKERDLFLAAGARGGGAIYTEHGQMIHIVRKVFLRVSAKFDWFVWKLH
jgi:hypothetical protein